MKVKKFRDLSLISINKDQLLVIACDSSGAVGSKAHDIVRTDPEILGYYSCNVALAEILAFGARPISIINTLAVELDQTGLLIIEGIKRALKPLSIQEDIIITGSSEENFPVCQTGVGITVLGIINRSEWKQPTTSEGTLAVVVGMPKFGEEVLLDKGEILTIPILLELLKKDYLQEILPVGSKGILYEARQLAESNNLQFVKNRSININIEKSAGPATCAVVSVEEKYLEDLQKSSSIPVNIIGTFYRPGL